MTKKKSEQRYSALKPIPFGETTGVGVYNSSELVAIADSRLLFCDNNITDALLELVLTPEGQQAQPLARVPICGLPESGVDDMEGLTLVHHQQQIYIFACPSLSLKTGDVTAAKKRLRAQEAPLRRGLVRIRVGPAGQLDGELIPDFRGWLLANTTEIGKAARWIPDDGGLNVEGLGWDPKNRALLLGVRSPVSPRGPLIFRVALKDLAGPWTLDNLEMLSPVFLKIERANGEQGIRCLEYDPARKLSLIVVGNSTSAEKAPFQMYAWDGNEKGVVRRFKHVRFAKKMKPEGVTHCTIDDRGAVVFVDDCGGYLVVWDDDPRLRLPRRQLGWRRQQRLTATIASTAISSDGSRP